MEGIGPRRAIHFYFDTTCSGSRRGEFDSKTTHPDAAVKIGEATLTLHSCRSATLVYTIEGTNFQGTKNLVRIVGDNVANCQVMSGDQVPVMTR